MDSRSRFKIKDGRFSLGISIEATPSDVWRVITDTTAWPEWGPSVGGINATGHRIISINDDCCMLFFDMPIWAIPYSIICFVALNRIKKLVNANKKKDFELDDFTS